MKEQKTYITLWDFYKLWNISSELIVKDNKSESENFMSMMNFIERFFSINFNNKQYYLLLKNEGLTKVLNELHKEIFQKN